MIDTNYKLSLDSIESNMNLSFDKFKKVSFNKSNYYDELIPYFYKDLPAETAYIIKYENDAETMSNDFAYQYDELYNYGARNIIDNKNYSEEYEYFAPLYITKTGLPKNFIVFRVDGPGIGTLTTTNFNTEIISKLKTVKLFDLTKKSQFGEWLYTNFVDNKYFPDAPLEIDFRNLEFCRWNGIDYQNGGYTSKSLFIDDILDEEKEIFELEKFVFDSYKNNKVVFPNILNLSFLFDDTPSTPEQKIKWSINRYYGFYLDDLELVTTMSSYITVPLKNDIFITDNILYSTSEDYPFQEIWSDKKPFYVEYKGNYYKVEQYTETITNKLIKVKNTTGNTSEDRMQRDLGFSSSKKQASSVKIINTKNLTTNIKSAVENYGEVVVTKYRIISDLNFSGMTYSSFNQNFGEIKNNILIDMNANPITIDNFDSADIWLIDIDGIYHNLIGSTNSISVNSDYSFQFNENSYTYKVNGVEKTINTIVDFNNPPTIFNIYKAKLTDIKDFDDRLVDTEYSKYEYEKLTELTNTDETKMYFEDLTSKTDPRDLDDFVYKNEVVKIPVSSEYTANYETFKIDDSTGNLSELWRKNSVYCRFGFQNSISGNDVPYLLNNSLIFEDYNRTVNISDMHPKRIERNLDYFYTINSATSSYLHHTLHVEGFTYSSIDNTFKFELDKYLNLKYDTVLGTYSYDYFSYFFSKQTQFLDGNIKKNTRKYSYFNVGDDSVPNHSLFRGIRFDVYKVEGVNLNSNSQIEKINISTNNDFVDYKMSVLLSDNDISVTNTGSLTQSASTLQWTIIDEWKMDKIYASGSVVIFDDILYQNRSGLPKGPCGPTTKIIVNGIGVDVISNPNNQDWNIYSDVSNNRKIFWSPSPHNLNYIYNSGEYYYLNESIFPNTLMELVEKIDFWNPEKTYNLGKIVVYNKKTFISNTDNNIFHPNQKQWVDISTISKFDSNKTYSKSDIVTYVTQDGNILTNIYYISLISNNKAPGNLEISPAENGDSWDSISIVPTKESFKWGLVEIWNPNKTYPKESYVVHNEILYKNNNRINSSNIISPGTSTIYLEMPIGFEPGVNSRWRRTYSLVPDTDYNYGSIRNSIILLNDKYYMATNATSNSTLDNGIIIYINKKWKNILVNINISDNTYTNVSSTNRDDLYNELYKKLTAVNFMTAINDITNKYGFTDYVSYVVIDEDNTINKYSYTNNIVNLPYIIKCEGPDSLDVKIQSLLKKPIFLPNTLNPIKKLDKGIILNIDQLNYYNDNPVGVTIIENQFTPKVTENYHGSKNIISDTIYRFSGYYMPLFYDIDLFKRDYEYKNTGNYLFDTTLTNFGIVKERKVGKINRKGSILKLKDEEDEKSIYPMLDEFGYSIYDFFIFSSTWDLKYYLETSVLTKANKDYLEKYTIDENIVNNNNIKIPITIPTNIGPSN